MSRKLVLIFGLLVASLVLAEPAFASATNDVPWEKPLEAIQKSLTGPVASAIALGAVAVAGGMLIFGGELNDFARRLMYVVLVAGILLGAQKVVSLFGTTAASIGAPPVVQAADPAMTADG